MKDKEYFLHKLEAITWLRAAIADTYGGMVEDSSKYLECTEVVNDIEKQLLKDYKKYLKENKNV